MYFFLFNIPPDCEDVLLCGIVSRTLFYFLYFRSTVKSEFILYVLGSRRKFCIFCINSQRTQNHFRKRPFFPLLLCRYTFIINHMFLNLFLYLLFCIIVQLFWLVQYHVIIITVALQKVLILYRVILGILYSLSSFAILAFLHISCIFLHFHIIFHTKFGIRLSIWKCIISVDEFVEIGHLDNNKSVNHL